MLLKPAGGAHRGVLLFFVLLLIFQYPVHGELEANIERKARKRRRAADAPVAAVSPAPAMTGVNAAAETDKKRLYVCPMHADYRGVSPGICGVCGMSLLTVDFSRETRESIVLSRRQVELLTLRFSEVRRMKLERWIRTAARRTGNLVLEGRVFGRASDDLTTGLRIRAFPMESRAQIFGGRVTSALPDIKNYNPAGTSSNRSLRGGDHAYFQILLDSEFEGAGVYVVEIIIPLGERLSIPADAILFTGDRLTAFKVTAEDTESVTLTPAAVRVGARGEVYYEIVSGLEEGDRVAQVGLFYLDAAVQLNP